MSAPDQRIAKSSITIDVVKQINTNCDLFDMIIYVLSGKNEIMIEQPKTGRVFYTPAHKISEYIQLKQIKTNWLKHIDGSFSKFDQDNHYHIIPLNNEFEFYKLKIEKSIDRSYFRFIRPIKTKHFSLVKSSITRKLKQFRLSMTLRLPIWPMWALIKSRFVHGEHIDIFTLSKLYMQIGEQFYRFPYGNVNASDSVCTGGGNNTSFKSVEQIFINWITTTFNFDYKHHLNFNLIDDPNKKTVRLSGMIPITYDLDHINMMINVAKKRDKLNIIDMLFYLSHLDSIDHIDYSKLFIKHPGIPERAFT